MDNREAFEAWAKTHGGLDLTKHEAMGNEKLPFPCTYYIYATEIAWRAFANKKVPVQAALASLAQQPTDLSKQLREYAADSGYSHNDYADTLLAAASEIERCAAQAQQESQWISVEEAKATLKDGDLIYAAFQNGDVSKAVYRWEQGYYPHRITSEKYGNERLEICTHVMRRKPTPLPPAPEGESK